MWRNPTVRAFQLAGSLGMKVDDLFELIDESGDVGP
jgi:hypothetical protein